MKVLWITNIMFPDISKHKGLPEPNIGGWIYSSAKSLLKIASHEIVLAVATTYRGEILEKYTFDGIIYYLLPSNKLNTNYNRSLEEYWQQVNKDFKPDIVHLHGTEFAHGLAFINACRNVKSVVSIQGLVSVYDRYYLADISHKDILKNVTFRDLIKFDTIWHAKRRFTNRGKNEQEILRTVNHIIGRTTWDRAQTYAINPTAQYHFCNETLREEFYKNTWTYEHCEKHSIFLSQASYPIKGLHKVLKALPFIIREFPDTKLYVAGDNITRYNSLREKLSLSGYGKYIRGLLAKHNICENVVFLGSLTQEQMISQYLKANVFVCPSSIENSPNSLGEAQLLGVPCISSYVGGVMDMMQGVEQWMYRFEEIEMLAKKICELFATHDYQSLVISKIAKNRHNKDKNAQRLVEIYKTIEKN